MKIRGVSALAFIAVLAVACGGDAIDEDETFEADTTTLVTPPPAPAPTGTMADTAGTMTPDTTVADTTVSP